jgi:hypothetical protein
MNFIPSSSPPFRRQRLSALPSDILSHCLVFLGDGETMIETLSRLEDSVSSSSNVLECTSRCWNQLFAQDQIKTNQQWKKRVNDDENQTTHDCARKLGREFLRARSKARAITQLSGKVFDYGCTPVPFFCPTPIRILEEHQSREQLRPAIWPPSQQERQYVFVNISQRNAGGTWWEGFRPLEQCSASTLEVSLNLKLFLEDLPCSIHTSPVMLYYRMIARNRGQSQQRPHFIQDGDDESTTVMSIPISKCQQLASVMRQLQVTILYEEKVVVATGGSQRVVSPVCGRFHDRKYSHGDGTKKYSKVVTSLEFQLQDMEKFRDKDRLCIKVSRA